MKALRAIGIVLLWLLAIILVLVIVVVGLRTYNGQKDPGYGRVE